MFGLRTPSSAEPPKLTIPKEFHAPKDYVPSDEVAQFLLQLPTALPTEAASGASTHREDEVPAEQNVPIERDESGAPRGFQGALSGPRDARMPVIAADSALDGIYVTPSDLQVDGLARGEIICLGTLVISEGGCVQARVEAAEVVVAGRLQGDVQCQGRIEVLPSAWVKGKLTASTVAIQEGAYFSGEISLRSQRAQDVSPNSESLAALLEKRRNGQMSVPDLRAASSVAAPIAGDVQLDTDISDLSYALPSESPERRGEELVGSSLTSLSPSVS